LIALSFEAVGQRDSAHIEYRKLFDDMQDKGVIAPAALHNATLLGRSDDAKRFAEALPVTSDLKREDGELIVFVESGAIAPKLAGDLTVSLELRLSFPYYPEGLQRDVDVDVQVDGDDWRPSVVNTQLVDVARTSLEARGRTLATKQALRTAAKYNIGQAAEEQDEVLGSIVKTVLFVLEQADTRSWETLPEQLALVRIPLTPGNHNIELSVSDGAIRHERRILDINVQPGQKIYRALRVGAGSPSNVTVQQ